MWSISQNSIIDSAKYFDNFSDFEQAEKHYEKGINRGITNDSIFIETLISLARVKRINQKYPEGINLLEQARHWSDSIGNLYLKLKTEIQIGDYYRAINALETSYNFFNNLKSNQLENFPKLLNQYYHRKAAVYNEISKMIPEDSTDYEAIILSKKALSIARKYKWTAPMATSYNEISHIFKDLNKLEMASTYCDSARSIFLKESKLDYVNVSTNKLGILTALGNHDECIELGFSLLELIKGNNWPYTEYPILYHISESYFAKNDSLSGYKYQSLSDKKYSETLKGLFEKDLTELQVEFDIYNKEIEIEIKEKIINQANSFQKRLIFLLVLLTILILVIVAFFLNGRRKNKKLEALLKENAFLTGEANHRIKNNLQLIVSLLSEELRKPENQSSQQLLDIKAKIESISTLHQFLYLNEDKSTIDIEKYLSEIIENFSGIYQSKQIEISFKNEVEDFPIEKALHLGLLLTELLINSLKYAFIKKDNKPNEIKFSLRLKEDLITFQYHDNGVGLKEGEKPKLVELLTIQLDAREFDVNLSGYNFKIEFHK